MISIPIHILITSFLPSSALDVDAFLNIDLYDIKELSNTSATQYTVIMNKLLTTKELVEELSLLEYKFEVYYIHFQTIYFYVVIRNDLYLQVNDWVFGQTYTRAKAFDTLNLNSNKMRIYL